MSKKAFENAIDLPFYIQGENEPLLMIHGIISSADFFNGISDCLKKDFKMISYDRRGYGLSEQENIKDFTVSSQAEDAAKILSENVKEPAWIFGNSAGGLIAIELALKYPELVRGLILMEPSLAFDDESKTMIAEWNSELNGYVQAKKIKKALPAFSRVIGNENEKKESVTLSEMKQTYKNLSNFMFGELNEVQNYRPEKTDVKSMDVPVVIYVTEDGVESIFAKTSLNGAKELEWKVEMIPGYHNTVKENPLEISKYIKKTIDEMREL